MTQLAKLSLVLVAMMVGLADAAGTTAQNPAEPPDQRVARLIEQLGSKDYYVRQRAQDDLAALGFEAFDALSAATTNEDLEIASRAKYLLRLMRVEWTTKNDSAEVKQLLHDYENQDGDARMQRMHALAALGDGAGTAALCRLVRFEKSAVLSKWAAMELMLSRKQYAPPKKAMADEARQGLDHSTRPASVWILTWLRFAEDPAATLGPWSALVAAEEKVLQRTPSQTNPRLVVALLRLQIHWQEKLGHKEDALASMRRLIDLEKGDVQTLVELVDWLVEQKAWKVIDDVSDRFATRFASNAVLLYALAEARASQGLKDQAEETARRAFELNQGKMAQYLLFRVVAAQRLRLHGYFAWARREYRYIIQQGPAGENITVHAQLGLSEMLHDQGEDLEAAEVLQEMVRVVEKSKPADEELAGRTLAEHRSRMNYFFACHWKARQDQAKAREYLDKASEADNTDIDVLIECYRLTGQPEEYRKKIVRTIQEEASRIRAQINEDPDNATNYNQFAWLIGNTEGDMDEALRFSKKSIELSPDAGGYYDTLARVYYAKGDYQGAVKNQARAQEMDPHSGLIAKQLEFFRKALAEKQK